MRASVLVVFIAVLVVPGCKRPPEEDCRRICWKAGKLAYWHKVEEKLALEKDAETREILREEADAEWKSIEGNEVNPEFSRCLLTCQKKGRPKQVKCIDEAETHEQVMECLDF